MRKRIYTAFAAALIAGCAAPWAKPTALTFTSGTTVIARAKVFQSVHCGHFCHPAGGSDIVITMEGRFAAGSYRLFLAQGSCDQPRNTQAITAFDGKTGARAHVNVPIVPLTRGDYVLTIERKEPHLMACTVVTST
ncbi:MAG: hypothetical protein WBW76_08555 [Candidatus Cybelea sp.]